MLRGYCGEKGAVWESRRTPGGPRTRTHLQTAVHGFSHASTSAPLEALSVGCSTPTELLFRDAFSSVSNGVRARRFGCLRVLLFVLCHRVPVRKTFPSEHCSSGEQNASLRARSGD